MDIKEIRIRTGLSQSKFAEKFCIPPRTLQEWEQKRHEPPSYVVYLISCILELENKQTNI